MSITYFENVSVVVVTQHAMHLRHFVVCRLPGSESPPHYLKIHYFQELNKKCVF